MPIRIQQYRTEHAEAVRQFNDRLSAGGATAQFPPSPVPQWLPKIAGRQLFQEYYLATDETGAVRGAYILKRQDFWIGNRVVAIADFHLPISEGVVNKHYPQVGVQLLWDALQRQPLLFGLGIGGYDEALTRLLRAAGWSTITVPFFFRVVRPSAFLRNLAYLRRSAARRLALDALAWTGLGWLGLRGVQSLCCRPARPDASLAVEVVGEFSDWTDELWQQCRSQYGMSAVRDAETLSILYPKEETRFIRLRVSERNRVIGWAVLLNTQLVGHKHFGDMRLGSIVDCLAYSNDAGKVACAAREFLETRGVDLIVSNQSHVAWQRGLRQAGFLRGPSNFVFASSRKLTELLGQGGVRNEQLHLNRGDGDGPINL
jgi:hypothetical protein